MTTLSLNMPNPHPLYSFMGKRVVLHIVPVTHAGLLAGLDPWIRLTDAAIVGNRKVATVAKVFVNRNAAIAHVHLEADVTGIEVIA